MPDDNKQVGDGDKGPQGDGNNKANDPANKSDDGKAGDKKSDEQFVTPTILTGVLEAQKRGTAEEFRKVAEGQKTLQETIAKLTEKLEESVKVGDGKNKKKDDSDSKDSAEVVELRRQNAQFQASAKESADRASELIQQKLDMQFEQIVRTELIKAECVDVAAALLVIKPHLKQSEDGNRVFSTVQSTYGESDVELAEYIARTFSEDICPFLFKGKMRSGSPASGDSGGGSGKYLFDRKELLGKDVRQYMKDPEAARAALESGGVKGFKRGESQ